MPIYSLRFASDGTYAAHASGPEAPTGARLPDMQLLGWAPSERAALLDAARAWLAGRGIVAGVVLA